MDGCVVRPRMPGLPPGPSRWTAERTVRTARAPRASTASTSCASERDQRASRGAPPLRPLKRAPALATPGSPRSALGRPVGPCQRNACLLWKHHVRGGGRLAAAVPCDCPRVLCICATPTPSMRGPTQGPASALVAVPEELPERTRCSRQRARHPSSAICRPAPWPHNAHLVPLLAPPPCIRRRLRSEQQHVGRSSQRRLGRARQTSNQPRGALPPSLAPSLARSLASAAAAAASESLTTPLTSSSLRPSAA